jgi:hypothetical protein
MNSEDSTLNNSLINFVITKRLAWNIKVAIKYDILPLYNIYTTY